MPAAEAIDLLAPGMQLAVERRASTTPRVAPANLRQFETTERRSCRRRAGGRRPAAAHADELSEGLATVGPVARCRSTLEDTLGILVEPDNKGLDPADKGATALRGTMSALLDPL